MDERINEVEECSKSVPCVMSETGSRTLHVKANKNRKVDKLGRVVIPKTLREMAGIQDGGEVDIMLVIDENGARVVLSSVSNLTQHIREC